MFLKIWAKTIKAFLSFDLSMISAGPECALTGDTMIASWANKWFITQAGIWMLLFFFITLRLLLAIATKAGLASRRTKNQCTNCIIALYCLVYTTWIQACLKPFACAYREGVPEGEEGNALNNQWNRPASRAHVLELHPRTGGKMLSGPTHYCSYDEHDYHHLRCVRHPDQHLCDA